MSYCGLILYSNHTYTFLHILRKFLGSCCASLFILVVPVFIWYASKDICSFNWGVLYTRPYDLPSTIINPCQFIANNWRRLHIFNQYVENITMCIKYFQWLGLNCYVNNKTLSIVVKYGKYIFLSLLRQAKYFCFPW